MLLVIIGIYIVPIGQPGDSADNFLGGCLIFHHARLYTDFVSQHNPLMYYITAGIYNILGHCDILIPRYIFYALFVGILCMFWRLTGRFRISFVLLLTYGLLSQGYSNHLVLGETWIMFMSLLTLLLLWFYKRIPRMLFWGLFILVQFSFITVNPIYIPITFVLLFYFIKIRKYNPLTLIVASFIPALLLFSRINMSDYVQSVIVFNQKYYPICAGSPIHIYLHYAGQVVRHLNASIVLELFLGILLILVNFKRGLTGWICIIVGLLLAIRPEGFRLQPFVFYTTANVLYILPKKNTYVQFILLAIMVWIFIPVYLNAVHDPDSDAKEYIKLINSNTQPGDKVLIYPGRAAVYIVTGRMPGSYYDYFAPCFPPTAQDRVISDIMKNKVALVIIDNKHNAFGKGLPRNYMTKIIEFMDLHGYEETKVDQYISFFRSTQ